MYFLRLLGRAFVLWFRRGADESAAALAYFMPFALTPLIILSISIVGLMYGAERITNMLIRWGNAIDPGVTDLVYSAVTNFDSVATHYYLPIIGLAFLSLMIFIAFNTLTIGFHKLWGVEIYGWRSYISRFWRITLFVLVVQCYFVALMLLEDIWAFAFSVTGGTIWPLLSFMTSFLLTMLLLTIAYGLLALRAPSFSGRFLGAAVAGLFLLFSRELVAFHFATAPVQTLFGAAGLLITLLVWVYVAASIILYGAAFARVYDEARGKWPTN
jgi:membrane protein